MGSGALSAFTPRTRWRKRPVSAARKCSATATVSKPRTRRSKLRIILAMHGIFPFAQDFPIAVVTVLRPPEPTPGGLGGQELTLGPPVAVVPRTEILMVVFVSAFVSTPGNL